MTDYCVQADIEKIFGSLAVARWADLDGDADPTKIATRIAWACELATEYINSRLIECHYVVPFTSIPIMIVNLAAMKAGTLLYDGRLITSTEQRDEVGRVRKDFDRYIKQILRGQLKLIDPTTNARLALTVEYAAPFVAEQAANADELVSDDGTHIIFGG